jgi:hypothetical protein
MSNQGEVYDGVESILAKLHVLRDSCTGVMHKEESNTNLIWFQGAETLLSCKKHFVLWRRVAHEQPGRAL